MPETTNSGKIHYHALDGLRGVAAISVFIYHCTEHIVSKHWFKLFEHAYLSVDFFFCLSGFVIGYAYDDRIKKIGVTSFLTRRLIRLHPLVVLSSIFGLFHFFSHNSNVLDAGATKFFLTFLCSILLIPFPGLPGRYDYLFPLNAVLWSLFMEYIANIFYAVVISKIRDFTLFIISLFAALLLVYVSWQKGNLDAGAGTSTIIAGFARIAFSFIAGLLIYRCKFSFHIKIGFGWLALLLLILFTISFSSFNWLSEAFIVITIFPSIILIGINTQTNGLLKKVCIFLGNISYPLYIIHYSAAWAFASFYKKFEPRLFFLVFILIGATVFLVITSYLILKVYDEPVRYWLKKKVQVFL